jgi:hypothetical protein
MTVSITNAYLQQVRKLLSNWDSENCLFKVRKMHKLVSKLVRLGKGAPWIYKLMSHLYTSLAHMLKNNKKLLKICLKKFRDLISQIKQKQFFGKQTDLQQNVNFVFKRAAKMVNIFGHKYLVNCTIREELNFISEALKPDSGIVFKTPIAHLIPRIPMASIIGNSSLLSCGNYSTTLKFWWHLTFLPEITTRTLLHLKDNSDKSFISINSLEFCDHHTELLSITNCLCYPKNQ